MSIENVCPGCSRRLRVAEEHAGRQARCPSCNTIYAVPGAAPPTRAAPPQPPDAGLWYLGTPEGRTYGPVSRQELDRWLAEGRISADCRLRSSDRHAWQKADVVYPSLHPVAAPNEGTVHPQNNGATPAARAMVRNPPPVEPHRGAVVLALGIVSWVSCPVFGAFAWALGTSDLRNMRAGRMDKEGRSLTQAGQVLGMVHVVVSIVFILLFFCFMLLMGLAVR